MVACSACGEANRERAKFCAACGAALARRCPACGTEVAAGARFCDECGASTEAPATATAIESVAEVRKIVTIVFADLAGSTALEERMDPESVRAVMQRYYGAIRDVIDGCGGRLVKFIGDGAMAVFGIPETHEDDALRALEAALAMHDAFEQLATDVARERGASIALRVGVNTGEVVVSADDADVLGDAVNIAARLEHAAASGGVLVGETTWRLTRGRATFGEMRELHVAGKAELVRAWPLVGVTDDAIDLHTDLVGRGAELRVLHDAFADVVESSAPGLVTVLGSPGVGKTRLVSELERAVADAATVLVVRCTQQTEAPLAPVADMLHAAVGGSAADPDDTLARLRALLDDDADRDRVLSAVGAILAAGAAATPEESLWALRRLVEQRARVQPVVLVVDDVQWAESMLLDLVEHLAGWTRGPLLVVLTARPELRERRAMLADGARHAVVALEGLDGDATADLAKEILGARDLPAALLERLPASTGGNPLFVREMVRMLVDDDVLRADSDGTWELRVAADAIDVPPTIQSLLSARVDRLTPDEQIVLERAAVWGTEVPLGALVDLLPPDIGARLEVVLELLRRKELMESAGSYWIDEPVHRFHHVLIRDAAYRRMLRDVRASLHERLAEWVDAKTQSMETEFDELVGHHLEQAYLQRVELGPPDAHVTALGRAASARLGFAAQRALDRDDPSAGPLTARALACLPADDESRADLLLIRCDALLVVADSISARDAIAELEAIAASPRVSAWAACFAAQLATITDPAHLIATEQRAAAVAAELVALGDARGAAKAHAVHAGALTRLGRFGDVEAALDRALTSAREAGDRRLATVALAAAPVAALWGPSPVPRAGGRCLDVVRLLRITAGSPVVEATSLRCQAVLEAFRGRYDAARRLVGSAREMVEELGLVHGLLETKLFSGIVELGAGDLDTAERCLREAYDGLRALGADADAARAGALLARVALEAGDIDDAERLAGEAQRLAGDDLQAGISWRRVAAEVLARRGAHEEARTLADAAVEIASRTDALVHHADACAALAAVRRAAGEIEAANDAERQATELYERKGATALSDRVDRDEVAHRALRVSLGNRATRQMDTWHECFTRRDWDGLAELIAPDIVFEDRRSLMSVRVAGPDYLPMVKDLAAIGIDELTFEVIALRGEHVFLAELGASDASGSVALEGRAWAVIETEANDLVRWYVTFDDLDAAYDDLDRRYLEGEGVSYSEMVQLLVRGTRAWNERDSEALNRVYAADMIVVDGLTAGWGSTDDRENYFGNLTNMFEVLDDARASIREVVACAADAIVCATAVSATSSDGGAIDMRLYIAYHRTGSVIDRMEVYDEEHRDDALAAYRRLTGTGDELNNRAVETHARYMELFNREDWTAMRGIAGPDFRFDDRRRLSRRQVDGPVAVRHLAGERLTAKALATRGAQLALLASQTTGPDFSSDSRLVIETDDAGTLTAVVVFAPDDLDAAIAELDRRYFEGDSPPDIVRLVLVGTTALNARAWDAWRSVFAPDLVAVDRLSAGWGTYNNREDLATAIANVNAVVDDSRSLIREIVACTAETAVASMVVSATLEDGAAVETHYYVVYHQRAAVIDRLEVFDEDHRDDALAAFERLTATDALVDAHAAFERLGAPERALNNRCVEVFRRWVHMFATRDWASMSSVVGDDFVFDDRRPVSGWRESVDDYIHILADDYEGFAISVMAVRGERLALVRTHGEAAASGTSTFAEEAIAVIELRDDLLRAFVAYPVAEIADAFAEFDRRFIAGEGAPYADVINCAARLSAAFNARDWDRARQEYAPNVVLVDHFWGGWNEQRDVEGVFGLLRGLLDPLPGAVMYCAEFHALRADAFLNTAVMRLPNADEEVEHVSITFTHLGPEGIDRVETWPVGQLAEALSAFNNVRTDALENRCTTAKRVLGRAVEHRDWDALRACFSPSFGGNDHRRGMTNFDSTPVDSYRTATELGLAEMLYTPIAIRGESLALAEEVFRGRGAAAAEVRLIVVNEVDRDGRIVYAANYDSDDFESALAELDERYVAREGKAFAATWSYVVGGHRAMNARDWDAFAAGCTPDVVTVDHTYGGWTDRVGIDAYIELMVSITEPFSETRTFPAEVLAISERAVAYRIGIVDRSRPADVSSQIGIVRVTPDGFDRTETFPPEQFASALECYQRFAHSDA
jgi:class 3 adenylate cyclase/tetratricopeptide (TPR) repeat protein